MKSKLLHTMAAAAVGVLIAGCGGGGGSSTPTLEVSGTAATGAALADAAVEVKCAAGTGTATTTATGSYIVSIENGGLPCIIKVSGTVGAIPVTLHSVTEAGADAGESRTTAKANVTPITEMIVAQLTAAMPSASFAAFDPGLITAAGVASASSAIVTALKAAGIDLTTIGDPLTAELVPPTATSAGNAYDTLLELLGETVTPESLPLVVNQIAVAATTSSTAGLTNAITAVAGGSLENCPQALSGKYRTIDYTGGTEVHTIDFKARTWVTEGSSQVQTITPSSTQACEFAIGDASVAIGPGGAGAFRAADTVGYIFPVQSHAFSSFAGTWDYAESGLNESGTGEHWIGKFMINADGSTTECEYDVAAGPSGFASCAPETEEGLSSHGNADGSFHLQYGAIGNTMYGYKAPNGVLTVFGTSNGAGAGTLRTHLVLTKLQENVLPTVGTVTTYTDLQLLFPGGVPTAEPLARDANTVLSVDAATRSSTRQRASDGRIDTFKLDYPVSGLRFREGTSTVSSVFAMPVRGLGFSVILDNMSNHFYVISMSRP